METGIYRITSPSGNFYLGSTTRSFTRRWQEHRSELKHKRHRNSVLQAAYDKYGADKIKFSILWECEPENCEELEQFLLEELNPTYNLSKNTNSPFKGRQHTDAAKEKCRLIHFGRKKAPLSEEHKQKISKLHKGIKRPPRSAEYREKQRIAQTGKKLSESHKRNISLGGMGKKRPHTDEHRIAISIAKKGKKLGSNNPASRKVLCIETGIIYETIKDAATWVSLNIDHTISHTNICSACRGKLKSAYGYHWKYADL